jgi:hypothetical protein
LSQWVLWLADATPVPKATGAIASPSVRGRAAEIHLPSMVLGTDGAGGAFLARGFGADAVAFRAGFFERDAAFFFFAM